jgi:hypothetical protein
VVGAEKEARRAAHRGAAGGPSARPEQQQEKRGRTRAGGTPRARRLRREAGTRRKRRGAARGSSHGQEVPHRTTPPSLLPSEARPVPLHLCRSLPYSVDTQNAASVQVQPAHPAQTAPGTRRQNAVQHAQAARSCCMTAAQAKHRQRQRGAEREAAALLRSSTSTQPQSAAADAASGAACSVAGEGQQHAGAVRRGGGASMHVRPAGCERWRARRSFNEHLGRRAASVRGPRRRGRSSSAAALPSEGDLGLQIRASLATLASSRLASWHLAQHSRGRRPSHLAPRRGPSAAVVDPLSTLFAAAHSDTLRHSIKQMRRSGITAS